MKQPTIQSPAPHILTLSAPVRIQPTVQKTSAPSSPSTSPPPAASEPRSVDSSYFLYHRSLTSSAGQSSASSSPVIASTVRTSGTINVPVGSPNSASSTTSSVNSDSEEQQKPSPASGSSAQSSPKSQATDSPSTSKKHIKVSSGHKKKSGQKHHGRHKSFMEVAETRQEAMLREAKALIGSLSMLIQCAKNRDEQTFKQIFSDGTVAMKRLWTKAEDITKNIKQREVTKKLFVVLKDFIAIWTEEANKIKEGLEKGTTISAFDPSISGEDRATFQFKELAAALSEAVQQNLAEISLREATELFIKEPLTVSQDTLANKVVSRLIQIVCDLVQITLKVFEDYEGKLNYAEMETQLDNSAHELETICNAFVEHLNNNADTPSTLAQYLFDNVFFIRDFAQMLTETIIWAIKEGWDTTSQLQVSASIKQAYPQIKQICNDLNTKKATDESKEKKDTDVNIWFEPMENLVWLEDDETEKWTQHKGMKLVKAGSLNILVLNLFRPFSEVSEIDYPKAFLTTYRSFTTPEKFWYKILESYDLHLLQQQIAANGKMPTMIKKDQLRADYIKTVRLRVCNVLNSWITIAFHDLSPNLIKEIEEFVTKRLSSDGLDAPKAKILASLKKQQEKLKAERLQNPVAHRLTVNKEIISVASLVKIPTKDIAEQLTYIDWQLYYQIKPVELLNGAWNNSKMPDAAPNVRKLTTRFNNVSQWCATTILYQERLKDRVATYSFFVLVAKDLFDLHNFNSMMAIIAGLNNAAISRLKFTSAELPKKHQKTKEQLEEVMSSTGSHQLYRKTIHSLNPPMIPYLGVYLQDLTFIEEIPNFVGEPPLIHFHKRRRIYKVIEEIQRYQQEPYKIKPVESIQAMLRQLSYKSDKELYELSLIREPREVQDKSLIL
jgi:hypothetical protein